MHSSLLPYGVSAIMQAAKLIDWANQKNAENAARAPSELAAPFHPPFTTLHVGTIEGGTAHNITAKDCRFFIEFRFVPGESPEDWATAFEARAAELTAEMQAIHPDTGIDLVRGFALPALTPETDGAAETLARRLTGDNGSHVVSYGTEGSQFQTRGYSTVICGPGDIAQAHQPDEFISLDQLAAGEAFMDKLLDQLCG
ncbi:MAG: M20/M25/M40 family metallo-hydrolase [Hoeflea sp.]